MNCICRHLNNLSFAAILIFLTSGYGQSKLDIIQKSLQEKAGLHIEFDFLQRLNNEQSNQSGVLEVLQSNQFIYYTDDVVILVYGESVTTYYNQYKNIIMDTFYPDEFNALTILSGDFSQVEIENVEENESNLLCDFKLHDTPYSGYIEFDNKRLTPTQLSIDMDDIGVFDIRVKDFHEIDTSPLMEKYLSLPDDWEVLDLHE